MENTELISSYISILQSQNICEESINKNIRYLNVFLNEYLLMYKKASIKDSSLHLFFFFSYYLPRKYFPLTKNLISDYINILSKFYAFLFCKNIINEEKFMKVQENFEENKEKFLQIPENYLNHLDKNFYLKRIL